MYIYIYIYYNNAPIIISKPAFTGLTFASQDRFLYFLSLTPPPPPPFPPRNMPEQTETDLLNKTGKLK